MTGQFRAQNGQVGKIQQAYLVEGTEHPGLLFVGQGTMCLVQGDVAYLGNGLADGGAYRKVPSLALVALID